jgi:hypothetical protein
MLVRHLLSHLTMSNEERRKRAVYIYIYTEPQKKRRIYLHIQHSNRQDQKYSSDNFMIRKKVKACSQNYLSTNLNFKKSSVI